MTRFIYNTHLHELKLQLYGGEERMEVRVSGALFRSKLSAKPEARCLIGCCRSDGSRGNWILELPPLFP